MSQVHLTDRGYNIGELTKGKLHIIVQDVGQDWTTQLEHMCRKMQYIRIDHGILHPFAGDVTKLVRLLM